MTAQPGERTVSWLDEDDPNRGAKPFVPVESVIDLTPAVEEPPPGKKARREKPPKPPKPPRGKLWRRNKATQEKPPRESPPRDVTPRAEDRPAPASEDWLTTLRGPAPRQEWAAARDTKPRETAPAREWTEAPDEAQRHTGPHTAWGAASEGSPPEPLASSAPFARPGRSAPSEPSAPVGPSGRSEPSAPLGPSGPSARSGASAASGAPVGSMASVASMASASAPAERASREDWFTPRDTPPRDDSPREADGPEWNEATAPRDDWDAADRPEWSTADRPEWNAADRPEWDEAGPMVRREGDRPAWSEAEGPEWNDAAPPPDDWDAAPPAGRDGSAADVRERPDWMTSPEPATPPEWVDSPEPATPRDRVASADEPYRRAGWDRGPERDDRRAWDGGPERDDRRAWDGGPEQDDRRTWDDGSGRDDRGAGWDDRPKRDDRRAGWDDRPERDDRGAGWGDGPEPPGRRVGLGGTEQKARPDWLTSPVPATPAAAPDGGWSEVEPRDAPVPEAWPAPLDITPDDDLDEPPAKPRRGPRPSGPPTGERSGGRTSGRGPRSRRKPLMVLAIALTAAVAAAAVVAAGTIYRLVFDPETPGSHTIAAPLDGRKKGELELATGAGTVTVSGADLGADLFQVSTPESGDAIPLATIRGDRTTVTLASNRGEEASAVEIKVNSRVPWRLVFTGGAKTQTVDFSAGRLSGLEMTGGATKLELTLPKPAGTVPIRLRGGLGELLIHAPRGAPARVKVTKGATNVTLDRLNRTEVAPDTTFTPNGWAQAKARYDIDAAEGIGTVKLDRR